ncbi:CRP-like cAMP-binding protein [Sphingomonas vulcanisoli]|uniref:CRP-like cAMP-binding protein n=1 Tax=Sphingomonas vulcanisoli TaxID=1658060 RepID=A0ABX0TQU8_9SPHN|nr:Crp/Fnr family transcriptional regulator [Sphingomonas vulcanisoli]NIJ07903.1 CRP-like cAMP-binding protein [Sphingomonas vulcanisoli]
MLGTAQTAMDAFLRRLLLRSALGPEEQAAIRGLKGQLIEFAARRDVVLPGQRIEHACLTVAGLLGRFDQMKDGSRQITAFYLPGDMCDLHSVVAPVTGWGLTALSGATLLQIAHADLRELARRYPALALAFWRDTTTDASILSKWVANIGRKDARARIAHLLCEMGLRSEMAGIGTRTAFRFDATQELIADAVGLTPIHVNRVLSTLRSEGVAVFRNRMAEVQDWDRLAAIAEFSTAFLLLDEPR